MEYICIVSFLKDLSIYVFLSVYVCMVELGPCCCMGFPLVAASRGLVLTVVHELIE